MNVKIMGLAMLSLLSSPSGYAYISTDETQNESQLPGLITGSLDTETVRIKRDKFGTPHIYAQSNYGLFFGYGHAIASDRLYQLEILKHSSQGRVAEILGADYVAFDENQRSLFWPDDIHAQISSVTPETRDVFQGFAAGINARIAEIKADSQTLMPIQFIENQFKPSHWNEFDVVMLYVGTMLLRFGDFNSELENLQFLQNLTRQHGRDKAFAIFNAVNPLNHPKAPTTIPKGEDNGLHVHQYPDELSSDALDIALDIAPDIALDSANVEIKKPVKLVRAGSAYSNAIVLGPTHLKNADAVLVNGPQFGWFVPAYTYSVGFHSPNWNAVGNTPVGYPMPMFGYNEMIAWGSTWGAGDNVDIFVEKLHPDGSNRYKHNGEYKNIETRDEIIIIKNDNPKAISFSRTVHGQIVKFDRENRIAYAKQRGWTGKEVETIQGWMDATKAQNYAEWLKAVSKSALNVNWYYADKMGNIGYVFAGAYPIRNPKHDHRLPVSGTGEMDWRGLHPPEWNPQTFNPKSGFIANWNNKPASGVKNPDEWWYSWSAADRVTVLQKAIKQSEPLTSEQAWALVMKASFADPNAEYFLPHMLRALEANLDKDTRHKEIFEILTEWDKTFASADEHGFYTQTANFIFRKWLARALKNTLEDDLPGPVGFALSSNNGYGTPEKPTASGLNITVGLKILYETLEERGGYDFLGGSNKDDMLIKALGEVLGEQTKLKGADIKKWKLKQPSTRFGFKNFMGVPQALPSEQNEHLPDMNRGTENNMTVFSKGKVLGYEVVPPGQSGFINPNGVKAPHYEDQLTIYSNLGKKRSWLHDPDIDQNLESEIILKIKPH